MSREFKIDYDILETFLCEEEKQYFIKWDKEWMDAVGGYGYDSLTHNIVTYYITWKTTQYIPLVKKIPVNEYLAKYHAKERDKKLTSIGI